MVPSQRAFCTVICASADRILQTAFAGAFLLLLTLLQSGCGGGGTQSPPPTSNPVPSIASISPSSATAGAPTQTLTIQGSNFLSSSTVTYNGQTHPATFVSSTQLTISLSASDQSTAGNYAVVVSNPGPGGGASSSVNFTVNNPAPALTTISPSVLAAGSPEAAITLTGSNFVTQSAVSFNETVLPTTFVSSTQLSVTVPASSLASPALNHLTVSSPSPGGGTSAAQTLSVVSVKSLVIMGTPLNGGPGNSTWQLSAAAVDPAGNPIDSLTVSLTASGGTLTSNQAVTDSSGTVTSSIEPPTNYSGEAVVVTATVGSQIAAINIVFAPSVFSPTQLTGTSTVRQNSILAATATSTTGQFVFGSSPPLGFTNPFLDSNPCFSNVDLASTVPTDCQAEYNSKGIVQKVLSGANTFCDAYDKAGGIVSCIGSAASVAVCATGAGAVVCGGLLKLFGPDCLKYIVEVIASKYTTDPSLSVGMDLLVMGLQGGPTAGDVVGLLCDDISLANAGTGTSGTQITVAPPKASVASGTSAQFSSVVSGNSNSTVAWSINGVSPGDSSFGTITTAGLYLAPSNIPNPSQVTIRATSAADPTAAAAAVVTVFANLPGTITTTVGNGTPGYSGDQGLATAAQLWAPSGIAFDGGGNMFIADFKNNVVRRVDAFSGVITTIAGTGIAGYSGDGGAANQAQLNGPSHVAFDRTVNLYITDANNSRIRKVNAVTGTITTVAGNGVAGFSGDGGPATSAQLHFPDGIGLDGAENIYIGDALNNRIRKVDVMTGVITTIAGNGIAGFAGDGGLAINAELNFPSRPALDSLGNLYIADYNNNRVRRVDGSTGVITTVAGTGIPGFSGDGGPAPFAQLNGPISVTVDLAGNLYIGDINNERIRAVNKTSSPVHLLNVSLQPGTIETVAGIGSAGYSGDGGPATSAQINFPTGLLLDNQGNLYFADANNNVVRRVTGQLQ